MKSFFLSLICLFSLSALSTAQEQSLNDFNREYSRRDGIRHFTIPGFLARLAGNIALKDEERIDREAIKPLLHNMGSVSIWFTEDDGYVDHRDIAQLKENLLDENYEVLLKVRDGSDDVEVLTWGKKDVIRRLVFFVQEDAASFVMVNVRGYFTPQDISELADHYINKSSRKL